MSQGDHSLALSQHFVLRSWSRDPVSAVGHTRDISVANVRGFRPVLQHVRLVDRERGKPAGWQRNVLGMNCILVLTLPQAVLPDGRKVERSQL